MSTALNTLTLAVGWYGRSSGWGWTWWIWLPVTDILWLTVAVGVIWLAMRGSGWRGVWAGASGIDRARQILAERYAQGELTYEEYLERLGHLQ